MQDQQGVNKFSAFGRFSHILKTGRLTILHEMSQSVTIWHIIVYLLYIQQKQCNAPKLNLIKKNSIYNKTGF